MKVKLMLITALIIFIALLCNSHCAYSQQEEENMVYRQYDSTKTRVTPVFDAISIDEKKWLSRLLKLPKFGSLAPNLTDDVDLTVGDKFWGKTEKALDPPASLLYWLINNPPDRLSKFDKSEPSTTDGKRYRLWKKDPDAIAEATKQLQMNNKLTGWYVFEGKTHPDVLIYTPSAIIVIEGKRTEAGPTKSTTWMSNRHQMLRHIDAAWEIRGNRKVYGFFIVENETGDDIPIKWQQASLNTLEPSTISRSLPHRSKNEQREIMSCFIGVTTWQAVCTEFKLDRKKILNQ